MASQKKKYSLSEAVYTEATSDIRALFYTTVRIQDGRRLESKCFVDL